VCEARGHTTGSLLAAAAAGLLEGPQLGQLLEGLLVEPALRTGGPRRRVSVVEPANSKSREEGAVLALLMDTTLSVAAELFSPRATEVAGRRLNWESWSW